MMYEKDIQPNIRRMVTPSGRLVRIMDYTTLRYYISEIIDVDREEARMDADGEITINWKDSRGQGFGVRYSEWLFENQGLYIGQYLDDGAWKLFREDDVAKFNLDGDQPYSEWLFENQGLSSEPTKDPRHVTVFLASGNTLRFDNVTMIEDDKEQVEYKTPFTFSYVSQSDDKLKIGIINLNNQNIVGYSVYDPETEEVLLNNSEEEETNESK